MANHSIVHIEFPAHDPKAAGKFYGDLFGWKLQHDTAMDYLMFQPEQGPGGAFVKAGEGTGGEGFTHKPGEVLLYVSTDDIDASLAKVESLGGRVLMPKTEIPNVGWFGIFADPTGNRVALFTDRGMS